MTKERFVEICIMSGFPDEHIDHAWNARPDWIDGDLGTREQVLIACLALVAEAFRFGHLERLRKFMEQQNQIIRAEIASRNN